MWGFEKKGGGFSVPLTRGVVVFKADAEKLKHEAEVVAEQERVKKLAKDRK